MTAACIVQARMGSRRFPGKVMADLCGKPVIWHVLSRCKEIRGIDLVVLATASDDPANDALVTQARMLGCPAFGWEPEDDVLARYFHAAREVKADIIMRVTADCPLIEPEICADVLRLLIKGQFDYASNCFPHRTFATGLDCEAFTMEALEAAAFCATDSYDREHVTPWMQRNPGFHRGLVEAPDAREKVLNLCIDYPEDLARVREHLKCA